MFRHATLKLFAAMITVFGFLPNKMVCAEEILSEEDVTTFKNGGTNESILNWLESEDYIFAAERIPTNRWDTPANIHVITAEEIEKNHYRTVGEALSQVNGIVVDNLGMVLTPTIDLNGSDRVLLLVDGRRMISNQVSERQSMKSNLEVIPSIKMVERIEVVKSGMSALYGSDAVGGVVNIITKKGTRNETTVDISSGSWKTHDYEMTNQGIINKFSWFVAGNLDRRGYVRGSDLYNHGMGNIDHISTRSDHLNKTATIRLDNRFDDRQSLTLNAMHVSNHYHNAYTSFRFDRDKYGRIYNNVSLSYNFKEGTSTPSYLRYFDDYTSGSPIFLSYASIGDSARMQGIEYQNGWEIDRHKIIAGFEYHKHDMHTNERAILYNGTAKNIATYLQDTIKFRYNLIFIPGVRYDYDKGSGGNWSPKIAVNYRPDANTKIYGSWGRVYNPPSNIQLYTVTPKEYWDNGGTYDNYGNPNVRSEKGHTETIGLEHFFDETLSVALNYFQNDMNDIIYWYKDWVNSTPLYTPATTYNMLHEKRRGVELSLNKKLSEKWSINLGYSHVHAERDITYPDDDEFGHNSFRHQNRLYESDDHIYRVPNSYRVGVHYACGSLKINLLSNIGEGYPDISKNNGNAPRNLSSKCIVVDLNANYDMNDHLTLYAKARNLTNQNFVYLDRHGYSDEYGGAGLTWFGRFFEVGAICRF